MTGKPVNVPAGWYANPENPTERRYWDGTAWTQHTAPRDGPEPTIALPVTMQPPPMDAGDRGPEPWYQKKWVWGAAAVFGALALIGSFTDGNDTKPAAQKSPAAQPTAVVTVTQTPEPGPGEEPSQEPEESGVGQASGAQSPEGSQVGNNPVSDGETFQVPNEVGKSLQAAQDDLQAVTGNPFYFSDSQDATGAGRFQVIDSGWKVCSQNVAPGTQLSVDNMDIVFDVVRATESCP